MEWNGMEWNGNGIEWNGMEWNGMKSFVQNRCKICQKRNLGLSKLVMEAPKFEVGDVPDAHDQPRGAQEATKQRPRAPERRPRDALEGLAGSPG